MRKNEKELRKKLRMTSSINNEPIMGLSASLDIVKILFVVLLTSLLLL